MSPGLQRPNGTIPLRLAEGPPRFAIFVDTEEEFEWGAPFRREVAVGTAAAIPAAQARFARAGIQPIYLVTYPIVADPTAAAIIRALAEEGATVGAQLHPWVTPPFDEAISTTNSFAGNLPRALEAEKLRCLTVRIAEATGRVPTIYRAGRYGVGPSTAEILLELGYTLDVSVRPQFDYSGEGGPDFRGFDPQPFRTGPAGRLLALPLGVADTGWAPRAAERAPASVRRILARLRATHRVPLTPEGTKASEALRAIDTLLARGMPLLSLSFHSPSLVPGHTPYVRDADDLRRFDRWWNIVLDHLARRGVEPTGGDALIALLAGAERLPARSGLR